MTIKVIWLPRVVNSLVILGSQHHFSFSKYKGRVCGPRLSPITCPGLFLKEMISTATWAVTWTSLRTNSDSRSKDGGKSGMEC